ncbi:hypothetical protein GW796_06500 [archaeon]|nr:hypothetical protein [archaeon]
MSKLEKKEAKLKERIEILETELKMSLQKKSIGKAIDVSAYTRKIQDLKLELFQLK